jgi:hypothetical protein
MPRARPRSLLARCPARAVARSASSFKAPADPHAGIELNPIDRREGLWTKLELIAMNKRFARGDGAGAGTPERQWPGSGRARPDWPPSRLAVSLRSCSSRRTDELAGMCRPDRSPTCRAQDAAPIPVGVGVLLAGLVAGLAFEKTA